MKQLFVPHKFGAKGQKTLDQANAILDDYQEQGHTMTIRQLFYQFIARGYLPNTHSTYRHIDGVLRDGRNAGLIDWDMIEDRSRELGRVQFDRGPKAAIEFAADSYREDPWLDQPYVPIVVIEKEALLGVIAPVCNKYRITRLAASGDCSHTIYYDLGRHCARKIAQGKTPIVLHLTDHDPAGVISMPRDIANRLERYARQEIEIRRLGLTMKQVKRFKPPPNAVKEKDPRTPEYKRLYGDTSWELDALKPAYIEELITAELDSLIEPVRWQAAVEREYRNETKLREAAEEFEDDLGPES
jgi:hypothetical protein